METVNTAPSPVPDDQSSMFVGVCSVAQPLASESVQQQLMLTHSCESVTPGFHFISAALWMHREQMRLQLTSAQQRSTTGGTLAEFIKENILANLWGLITSNKSFVRASNVQMICFIAADFSISVFFLNSFFPLVETDRLTEPVLCWYISSFRWLRPPPCDNIHVTATDLNLVTAQERSCERNECKWNCSKLFLFCGSEWEC